MLGTLAIMGIITVTAIGGFRYAMNKHTANTILKEAQMQATLLTAASLNKGLSENETLQNLSHNFTYKKESEVGYSLRLENVNQGVCQILTQMRNLGWAETVLINNGENCKEANSVVFYINTAMTTEITDENRVVSCEDNTDCGECGVCGEQKVCIFDDFYCDDAEKPYCNKGVCQVCKGGDFYIGTGGPQGCYSCTDAPQSVRFNSSLVVQDSYDYCSTCSNRSFLWDGHTGTGSLRYCAKNCAGEGEFLDLNGNCQTCSSDSFYMGWSAMNYNHRLSSVKGLIQKCHDCQGMFFNDRANANTCYSCKRLSDVAYTSETECTTRCKGIRYAAENNTCKLCPSVGSEEWINNLSPTQKTQCCPDENTEAWEALTLSQQNNCRSIS